MSDEIEEQESGYEIQYAGEEAKSHFVHKDGLATAWFPNKDTFTGEYKDGKRHGKGKYTFSSGAVYEGDYLNNARHGVGTMAGPDGGRYEGEWQDNKRHGYGKYQYPNGDVYVGNWSKGYKNGDGTYTFANNQGSISGRWIEGQCHSGTLKHPDGAQYVGPFADNKPGGSGPGLFVSAAGHHQSGVFAGTEWKGDHFVRPHPHEPTPEPHAADHATAAVRAIDRAVLKLDHFQAIYRLPKVHEGVPNFRRVDGFPVFGSGQPTLSGFVSLLTSLGEQGFSKFVWTCMRQEPVIYVNEMSFAPRDRANLNENMEFEGITSDLLHTLQESLAGRYRLNSKEAGEVEFYQDTYAENPADRKNMLLKDKVDNPENVRSLDAMYTHLRESKNLEVDLHRLPIADERAPSAPDFDKLTGVLKDIDFEGTAVLFNCQMGKGRTTTGMVCACLMALVKGFGGGVHNDGEEEKEHDDEEKADESDEAGAVKKPKAKPVPKHVHENPPNLQRGEFGVINELVKKLPNGIHIKHEVDTAIDGAHHMQNLRECILYTKEMYDKETEERRKFWKRMSINFIERYFWLITYHAYLREAKASEFETPFVQWVKDHADLFDILGTRESGALSVFNWE